MDRYDGTELTLMVHHLLNGKKIADYTYTKYPDSLIYLILDDGSMLCLTYMLQEKVFGWTRFSTQGNYIAVETIKEDDTDVIYFVVERDGTITDVHVARGVDPYLDKEALRVVKSMPKWKPGKQRGKPVRVSYTVPVIFKLQ